MEQLRSLGLIRLTSLGDLARTQADGAHLSVSRIDELDDYALDLRKALFPDRVLDHNRDNVPARLQRLEPDVVAVSVTFAQQHGLAVTACGASVAGRFGPSEIVGVHPFERWLRQQVLRLVAQNRASVRRDVRVAAAVRRGPDDEHAVIARGTRETSGIKVVLPVGAGDLAVTRVPAGVTVSQVPPKLTMPWPAAIPDAESPENV